MGENPLSVLFNTPFLIYFRREGIRFLFGFFSYIINDSELLSAHGKLNKLVENTRSRGRSRPRFMFLSVFGQDVRRIIGGMNETMDLSADVIGAASDPGAEFGGGD